MKNAILAFLREHPNQSPTIIADNIQSRADSVRKALTILRRQSKVVRNARSGLYSLPVEKPTKADEFAQSPSETSTATQQ